jgi:hypothetical protein
LGHFFLVYYVLITSGSKKNTHWRGTAQTFFPVWSTQSTLHFPWQLQQGKKFNSKRHEARLLAESLLVYFLSRGHGCWQVTGPPDWYNEHFKYCHLKTSKCRLFAEVWGTNPYHWKYCLMWENGLCSWD